MLKSIATCIKLPHNLPQMTARFDSKNRIFCIKLQYIMTQTIYLDAQNCKIKLYFPLYISNWQELGLLNIPNL